MAAGHGGLWVYRDRQWSQREGPLHDFMGFSATGSALYSSGHPAPGVLLPDPLGLVKSTDGGKSWRSVGALGEAEFHVMTAGYLTNTLYVLNVAPNARMRRGGLYFSRDDGRSWKRCAAAGLPASIVRLAAHPAASSTLAAATPEGLFLSHDFGATFRRLGPNTPIFAVSMDFDGRHLYFASASPDRLKRAALDGTAIDVLPLPQREETDFVAYVAQSPDRPQDLAIGTRRRNVFLSGDGGATWQQIAHWGSAL
jgi:photosystem II stability/assembly factor-like uncharacterized protein